MVKVVVSDLPVCREDADGLIEERHLICRQIRPHARTE
jgi:hypothetical protein